MVEVTRVRIPRHLLITRMPWKGSNGEIELRSNTAEVRDEGRHERGRQSAVALRLKLLPVNEESPKLQLSGKRRLPCALRPAPGLCKYQ